MTMKDAISSISPDGERNAAKDQSWGGYVMKKTTGLSTAEIAAGKYKLIYVQRDGDQYVFTYDGTGNFAYTGYVANNEGELGTGTPAAATAMNFDAQLQQAFLGENFITGTENEFEEARNGGGEW